MADKIKLPEVDLPWIKDVVSAPFWWVKDTKSDIQVPDTPEQIANNNVDAGVFTLPWINDNVTRQVDTPELNAPQDAQQDTTKTTEVTPSTDVTMPQQWVVVDNKTTPTQQVATPPQQVATQNITEEKKTEASEANPEPTQEVKDTKAIQQFNEALDKWATKEDIQAFANKNPKLLPAIKWAVKNHFKNASNVEFFNKYSSYSDEQLYSAMNNGDFVVWDNQYALLSPEQRASFEAYKKLEDAKNTWEDIVLPDTNGKEWEQDLSASYLANDLRAEYNKMKKDTAYVTAQDNLNARKKELAEKDREIKAVADKVRAEHKWVPANVINWIIKDRTKALNVERDRIVDNYNIELGTISNHQAEMANELKFLEIENEEKRYVYEKQLEAYVADKEAMTEIEKMKFEEANKILAENRKMANDLALYEAKKLVDAWEREFKTIDDKLYTIKKDWTDAQLVIDWTPYGSVNGKYMGVQNYDNGDWTWTSLFTNKQTMQSWTVTTDAQWNKVWDYIDNLGTWVVTGYWWDYDWGLWLDIDWVMGQWFFAPMWWQVKEVWYDKNYWKYISVQLDDWSFAQYAHLSWVPTNLREWTTFGKNQILGQIWNTWNVKDINGNPVTAEWLKKWIWTHLDIKTWDSSWVPRTAQDTEKYLRSLWTSTKLSKEEFDMQKSIISSFRWNPEIKSFENALITNKNLITSLGTKTGAWDMAGIFQFMKSLDPSSVVREGEFQLAWSTAWFTTSQTTKILGLMKWDKLSDISREDFEKLALSYVQVMADSYDRLYNDAVRLYEQQELPVSSFPTRASDEVRALLQPNLITSEGNEFNIAEYEDYLKNLQNPVSSYYNDEAQID